MPSLLNLQGFYELFNNWWKAQCNKIDAGFQALKDQFFYHFDCKSVNLSILIIGHNRVKLIFSCRLFVYSKIPPQNHRAPPEFMPGLLLFYDSRIIIPQRFVNAIYSAFFEKDQKRRGLLR